MTRTLWTRRAAYSLALALVMTTPARAIDDAELRRLIGEAGLVAYWSFKPAPDFSYPDVTTGRLRSSADLKGRVVLVNGWATWCPPCEREMPSLEALHQEFQEKGLVVIGINVYDRRSNAAIATWLSERSITFVNVKAHDGGPAFPSGFRLPQTFLIDSRGRLIANKSGDWDWTSTGVQVLIRRLIGEI